MKIHQISNPEAHCCLIGELLTEEINKLRPEIQTYRLSVLQEGFV